jgi:hypothetical protein
MLRTTRILRKLNLSPRGAKSFATRTGVFGKSAPSDEVVENLVNESKDMAAQAIQNQIAAKMKTDDFQNMTLGQLKKKVLVTGLVAGPDSLIKKAPSTLEELKAFRKQAQQKRDFLPRGTSPYMACVSAIARTGYMNGVDDCYHQIVQVDKNRCLETGDARHDFRQQLGFFKTPDWADDVTVAVSEIKANAVREIDLPTGEKRSFFLGNGGSLQVFFDMGMLPFMHQECFKILCQSNKSFGGIFYPEFKDGIVQWKQKKTVSDSAPLMFFGTPEGHVIPAKREVAKEDVLVVCPKGDALVVTPDNVDPANRKAHR